MPTISNELIDVPVDRFSRGNRFSRFDGDIDRFVTLQNAKTAI